jgi:hypothetical protein
MLATPRAEDKPPNRCDRGDPTAIECDLRESDVGYLYSFIFLERWVARVVDGWHLGVV